MNASKHRADVEQLVRVFWIHLLDICSLFARSCKRGIRLRWRRRSELAVSSAYRNHPPVRIPSHLMDLWKPTFRHTIFVTVAATLSHCQRVTPSCLWLITMIIARAPSQLTRHNMSLYIYRTAPSSACKEPPDAATPRYLIIINF